MSAPLDGRDDDWISIAADGIQSYWLDGIENEDLRWTTKDAGEAAWDMATEVVRQIHNHLGGHLWWAAALVREAAEGGESDE